MRLLATIIACLLAGISISASAREVAVDSPAGMAARAAIAIARQTGTSIVITDGDLSRRRVPAIRGQMDAEAAVRRLASAIGGDIVRAGGSGWRIVAAPSRGPPRQSAASSRRDPAPSLQATPPPPPPPVEIVVLASKRQLPLDDYAGQVSIIDGQDLAFGGVGGTERIAQRLSSLSSTHLGSGRNKLFIRGIADSSFTGPTQATVGQYLGDLRLSYNAPDPDLRLSDLERVEVLEGPQGTLYGAGSLGGIIRLVPNAPELGITEGLVQFGGGLTQHGAASADVNATLNFPLLHEDVALRVTLDASTQGGYIDKPLLGLEDVNRTDIYGGRATLRFELSPDWTVDLMGVRQSNRSADSQYADRFGPPLQRSATVEEGSDADYAQAQLVVSGWIGDLRFRSSTGLAWQDLLERFDATLPDGPARVFTQSNDSEIIANETRIWRPMEGRWGWLFGLSYIHNETVLKRQLDSELERLTPTGVRNVIDEGTLYGEASYRLRPGLVATAGGRLTHTRLGGEGEDVVPLLVARFADVTASRAETVFLPSASLLAQMGSDTSLFLRYQEGFRPGGLAIEGPFVRQFDNDQTATYELGLRHAGGGRRPFDFDASLSYTRWQDIQADFIDGSGLPSTANIGDGTIWSASFSTGLEVTRELRLEAGAVINKGKVDDPDPLALSLFTQIGELPPELGLDDGQVDFAAGLRLTQVPNVARFAGRVGFEYEKPISRSLDLTAQGWASYVGKSRLGIGPELGELQGNYLDSGLTVRIGGSRQGVSLVLTNLFDVEGNRFALGTPFVIDREQVTPLRPRSIRLGFDAAF